LFQAWLALWQQEKTIVVGTRRALFLPFKNLKKIFICDEANPSYKSWDMAPRFHTRDAARLLASKYHAELHILTHTPSVETFFLFNKDSSKPLSIKPFSTSPYFIKPEKNSVTTIFTHAVEERIEDITNKETIFLFTNHRGSFNYLFCRDCKKVLSCPQCYSHFTYHQKTNSLRCHKCGFTQPISQNCPACGGYELIKYGAGTERVEECLRELLKNNPPQKIITIDTDTALPPRAQEKSTVHPIIIGTTAAWNRVPWKDIALMVYIDPDNLFFIPEYKTSEYGWYYLRDSLARLPKTAEFYIQTERPEHAVFQGLTDPNTFYTTELAIREKLKYPPYATLVKLYYGAPSINEGDLETKRLYHTLVDLTKQGYPITILSPMPLFPHFYNKKYWKAILLKFKPEHFKAGFKRLLPHIPPNWKIDINPNKVLTIT
jgi:primosomal protein N' (replication factor Y)